MKSCRECGNEVSESAQICPKCGAPKPADEKWTGTDSGGNTKASLKYSGYRLYIFRSNTAGTEPLLSQKGLSQ